MLRPSGLGMLIVAAKKIQSPRSGISSDGRWNFILISATDRFLERLRSESNRSGRKQSADANPFIDKRSSDSLQCFQVIQPCSSDAVPGMASFLVAETHGCRYLLLLGQSALGYFVASHLQLCDELQRDMLNATMQDSRGWRLRGAHRRGSSEARCYSLTSQTTSRFLEQKSPSAATLGNVRS